MEKLKEMTKSELIHEALMLHVDTTEIRFALSKPCEVGDWIYATDCYTCLRVKKSMTDKEYKPNPEGGRFPNAGAVFKPITKRYGTLSVQAMFSLPKDTESVRIEDWILFARIYNRVRQTTKLLGLDGWEVNGIGNAINSPLLLVNGDVEMLVMPTITKTSMTIECDNIAMEEGIDVAKGTLYYKEHKEAEMKREAERIERLGKNYNHIYGVQLAKYATVYVEADSEEEAMKIAGKKADPDDDDWDEGWEVSGCDAYAGEADDYMDCIYTADNEYTYDEYVELDEE